MRRACPFLCQMHVLWCGTLSHAVRGCLSTGAEGVVRGCLSTGIEGVRGCLSTGAEGVLWLL